MALPKISDEDLLNPIKRFAPGTDELTYRPPRSGTYRTARYPGFFSAGGAQIDPTDTPNPLTGDAAEARPPSAQPLGEGDALTSTTRLGSVTTAPGLGDSNTASPGERLDDATDTARRAGAVTNIGDFAKAAATGASIIGPGGPFKAALGIATGEIDPTGDFGNLNQDPSWDKAFGYETDQGLAPGAAAAAAAKAISENSWGGRPGNVGPNPNPTGKVSEGPSLGGDGSGGGNGPTDKGMGANSHEPGQAGRAGFSHGGTVTPRGYAIGGTISPDYDPDAAEMESARSALAQERTPQASPFNPPPASIASDGVTDNVPINADEGEVVLQRAAAQQYSPEVLEALNDPDLASFIDDLLEQMIADDELDTQEPDSDPDDEAGGQSGISDDNSGRGIAGPQTPPAVARAAGQMPGATRSRLGQINRVA